MRYNLWKDAFLTVLPRITVKTEFAMLSTSHNKHATL